MKLGAHFPQPAPYMASEEFAIRITGIGGTRLVTVAQIVAHAAHLTGLRARTLVQTVSGPDATYAWHLHPPLLHQLGWRRKIALGRNGIRVNAIAPGFTRTPMVKELSENPSSKIEQLLALSPLGRVAEPSEIAEAALWLTSPASSFVTGHVLVVDGGFTAQ